MMRKHLFVKGKEYNAITSTAFHVLWFTLFNKKDFKKTSTRGTDYYLKAETKVGKARDNLKNIMDSFKKNPLTWKLWLSGFDLIGWLREYKSSDKLVMDLSEAVAYAQSSLLGDSTGKHYRNLSMRYTQWSKMLSEGKENEAINSLLIFLEIIKDERLNFFDDRNGIKKEFLKEMKSFGKDIYIRRLDTFTNRYYTWDYSNSIVTTNYGSPPMCRTRDI